MSATLLLLATVSIFRMGGDVVVADAPQGASLRTMGGNIRVGLEDSLWAAPGRMAASNAEQVMLARKIIEGLGLEVATSDEAREILDLKGGDKLEV